MQACEFRDSLGAGNNVKTYFRAKKRRVTTTQRGTPEDTNLNVTETLVYSIYLKKAGFCLQTVCSYLFIPRSQIFLS